ncbi:hypothetical protein ACLVWU_06350 [Bdellovibrio sp. HCB290]|uniref:hypothetical protein n=1 Tax=Bdellovibrio sp. HCB290 TaxID=3394356 RepID=UPI0039B64B9A
MKFLKICFLLISTLFFSTAFATNEQLVGTWTRVGGDSAWGKIEIDRSLNAKGYRICNDTICGEPVRFRLASYGRTKLTISHTRATGRVLEDRKNFTSTNFFEVQGGRLTVREYQKSNIEGYPSLQYTMIMAKGRR